MSEQPNFKFNYIPRNTIKKGKLFGIPIRRWIEGLVFGVLTGFLISLIPFVPRVKRAMVVIFFIIVFAVCVKGIKNRSVIQIIIAEITFRHRRRRLHLRTPEYARKIEKEKEYNESYVEKAIRVTGKRKDEFVERYRTK